MALLQYYFDGEKVPVSVKPHGNKKHDNEPYESTQASVISSMKDKLQEMQPKKVINAMCKEVGRVLLMYSVVVMSLEIVRNCTT